MPPSDTFAPGPGPGGTVAGVPRTGGVDRIRAGVAVNAHRRAGGRPPGARRASGSLMPATRCPGTVDGGPGLQPFPRSESQKPPGGLRGNRIFGFRWGKSSELTG